jgi:hypothetical protein
MARTKHPKHVGPKKILVAMHVKRKPLPVKNNKCLYALHTDKNGHTVKRRRVNPDYKAPK